jgi:hypothetical protein
MTKHASPKDQIHSFLKALHPGNDWFELRGLQSGPIWAAYHCDPIKATEDAILFDDNEFGAYVTINPVQEEITHISRELASEVKNATKDQQVLKRNWLPIDVDPIRASGQAATDAEKQDALLLADEIRQYLASLNWSEPIRCASPNGAHLLYRIVLPNDDESKQLLKRTLEALSDRFSTDAAKVDKTLFNAARILRIPGTTGRKGTSTADRPHRIGELLSIPENPSPVSKEMLEQVAGPALAKTPRNRAQSAFKPASSQKRRSTRFESADALEAYLLEHGVKVISKSAKQEGTYLHLDECPIAGSSGGTSVSVAWHEGRVTYHNLHDGGQGVTWADVLLELDSRAEWPEPCTVAHGVAAGDPLPLDVLPESIKEAIREVHAYNGASLPTVYAGAMAVVSTAAQALADWQRDSRGSGPSSLYMLTIADPSERKSSSDAFFTAALTEFVELKAAELKPETVKYKAAKIKHDAALKLAQARISDKLGSDEEGEAQAGLEKVLSGAPSQPIAPQLRYKDLSVEALLPGLKTWPSGGILTTEAGQFFGGYSMNRENIAHSLSFYNEIWDGEPLFVDRKGSGRIVLNNVRLTLGLQVQPGILSKFLNQQSENRDSGFLSRLLLSLPEERERGVMRPEVVNMPFVDKFKATIHQLLNQQFPQLKQGKIAPVKVTLSPDAKAYWREFDSRIDCEQAPGGLYRDMKDIAGKSGNQALRIATLLYAFDNEGKNLEQPMPADYIQAGCALAEWHLKEAERVLMKLTLTELERDAIKLDEWLIATCKREGVDKVTATHAQQKGPGSLRTAKQLSNCASLLEELGRARLLTDGKRKLYQVNPALLRKVQLRQVA